MPLQSSHAPAPTAMTVLALVAAAIVKAHDPSWLARPVAHLARQSGVRPERVSRLQAKLLGPFLALLERASRRERPPRPSPAPARRARALLRDALLAVAAEIIGHAGIRSREVQDRVVAARDRLHAEHATFLRVYLAARQAPESHHPADPVVLEALAEAQREKARAESRSVKLALESLFDRYQFEGSRTHFVRAHRHHRVEDVLEAERRMGRYACRCHARRCDRYFAAILQSVARERRGQRERDRRERLRRHQARQDAATARAAHEHARTHPEDALVAALRLVAMQYRPDRDRLLYDGAGLGRRRLRETLLTLRDEPAGIALDRVEVGWRKWLATGPDAQAIPHVRRVLDSLFAEIPSTKKPRDPRSAIGILNRRPRAPSKPRPSPGSGLRISAARSGST